MSRFSTAARRLPRAGVDPIVDETVALALLDVVASRPLRPETIVVLLDDARCGIGLIVVSGTVVASTVVDVAERVLDPAVHEGVVSAAIIASVRPDTTDTGPHDDLADADLWLELDDVADDCGVELVEWFVLGCGIGRPRELVHAPPRWCVPRPATTHPATTWRPIR